MKAVVNKDTKNSTQHFSRHTNSITALTDRVRVSRSKISLSSCTRLHTQEKIQVSKYTDAPLFTNSGAVVFIMLYSLSRRDDPSLET